MKFKVVISNLKEKGKKIINGFKKNDNKKGILMGAIGVLTLLIFVVGATYAYFSAQSNIGARTDVDVITGTTDLLSFSFGDLINIQANEENFGQGMGNLSDDTTGTAILRANNTTNSVTTRYNIYLVIESNNFEYTTEAGTPEILLNVTDPNGNKVENITGLVHYEDGFDITTRTGGFLLIPDYVISATDTQTVQDWNIEVTFVNLDSDQQANTNKSLTGKLYMTQDTMSSYELTEINNINATTTYNSIDATLELTNGSGAVEKYYYGIEKSTNTRSSSTVEYVESNEPTYKFENLEPETEYTIYSYVEDENKIKSNIYSTEITTNEYILPKIDTVNHSVTLNSITVTVNATNGSEEIVKYMYSKDNGMSYEESTSNTHTFTNLTDTTKYDIKIKAVDSKNVASTEYYEAITTEVYILPVVASVDATTTRNSITLIPTGTNGTNAIDHYEYSINDGAYQTSNVFNNLTDNTEYTIKVKAVDVNDRESNPYILQVTTDAYKLPTISVSTSSTKDSITITINATPGDGEIVSYHYSRDDGSNYTDSSSNTYTFTNLSPNTTYYLKAYVTDSNGRTSGVYALTTDTLIPDVALAVNNLDNSYSLGNLSCSNATATYNQKYHRVEVSQINKTNNQTYGNCTLTYQAPSSKDYLNQKIINMSGQTQGDGQVVNEQVTITDYTNAVTLSQSDYNNVTMYSSSSDSSTSGTSNTNSFTFSGDSWSSIPDNLTSELYYHIKFRVPENGYYQVCYTISIGATLNELYIYKGTTKQYSTTADTISSITECVDLGYVDTNTDVKIVQYTDSYSSYSIAKVTFNLEQGIATIEGAGTRYEGKNPNNYVWFNNELWRIIGVFDEDSHGQSGQNLVKIIRANSIGGLAWHKSDTNDWTAASLKNLLNGAYLNAEDGTDSGYCYGNGYGTGYEDIPVNCDYTSIGINETYRNMIANVRWYLGEHSSTSITAETFYGYERETTLSSGRPPYWDGKIGLMYPSDYGYSVLASSCARSTTLSDYDSSTCAGESWLYGQGDEWTITPYSLYNRYVIHLTNRGNLSYGYNNLTAIRGFSIRPVLYLDSRVYVIDGNGTISNPYIIGM